MALNFVTSSLELYAGFGTVELIISANKPNKMAWWPYIITEDSDGKPVYTLDTTVAVIKTFPSYTPITWGEEGYSKSDFVGITAYDDSISLLISGIYDGSESKGVVFNPYYLNQSVSSTQVSGFVSAFYMQVSTLNTSPILDGTPIQWTIIPSVEGLSGTFTDYADLVDLTSQDTITGTAVSASHLNLHYTGTAVDTKVFALAEIYGDRYRNSPTSGSFTFSEAQSEIIFNPSVSIQIEDDQPQFLIAQAMYKESPLQDTTAILWSAYDTDGFIALSADSDDYFIYPYTFGQEGIAIDIGRIQLFAENLTKSYVYILSSASNTDMGIFRPYDTMTESSLLSTQVTRVSNDSNVYVYQLKVFGVNSAGIPHLISPLQYINWTCDNATVAATYSDTVTPYEFGTISIAPTIDNIYVRIVANATTTTPQICTVNFQVNSLVGSQLEDGLYATKAFSISFNEWLNESEYNPKFRFQYEPETQTTIYRPLSSATVYYNISNTAKLPDESYGFIEFTFNNGVCSLAYDNRNSSPVPSGVTYTFDTASQCICTIAMSVSAFGDGYVEYFIKTAVPKKIVFASIPVASSFKVYPEYRWDGTWQQVVDSYAGDSGNVLQVNALLSAYSLCHTENFYLCSQDETLDRYQWSIQSVVGNNTQEYTSVGVATAWLPVRTTQNSDTLSICAAVFTDALSSDMVPFYYDSPTATRFSNFATTFDSDITASNRQHIQLIGADTLNVQASVTNIEYSQFPVTNTSTNTLYLSGSYSDIDANAPFGIIAKSFYFVLTSSFWKETETASSMNSAHEASTDIDISLDDIGDSYLGVPQNEKTEIQIIPGLRYSLNLLSAYPISSTNWCFSDITEERLSNGISITAYPMSPVIYNPNRFVLTGDSINFENLVQYFSGTGGTYVSAFTWIDRNSSVTVNTNSPYITSFDTVGDYDIRLRNEYYSGTSQNILINNFSPIVTIQDQYVPFDSDIIRVFEMTKLELPHDFNDCSMAPNEWVTKDTFNSMIIKLYQNLEYLDNMSQLYDVPPTDYIGWYGTLYYNNSTERTRWFANIPYNRYGYDRPDKAIDGKFSDLQDCFVTRNLMYVSNGTEVSILSGDLWGTQLGNRTYKTIGDDFINIRSIALDSEDRIYLLDSYNPNNYSLGNKNRVLVFSFDFVNLTWKLLYEWGGLGGTGAKNKFNNPSDLHIDSNDMLWIADTDNKCVKKFTRTGSWLLTMTSSYFTDSEKPVSITSDVDGNIYVLTSTQVLKFNSDGEFVSIYTVVTGATKIRSCKDGGFLYIVYSNKVVKLMLSGDMAGTIGNNQFPYYVEDYRSVYHDEYRNLYVVAKNHILKYVDQLYIVSLKLDTTGLSWDLDKLLVQKDEYVQDWVINRCFQRLWDNLEIFRQSLIGKFGYQTFRNSTVTTIVSSQPVPEDFNVCERDWLYSYGRPVEQTAVFEYDKPIVRSFTPSEYNILPHNKNTVYVGINEINSADVYNRVVSKLYECENILLQMVDS